MAAACSSTAVMDLPQGFDGGVDEVPDEVQLGAAFGQCAGLHQVVSDPAVRVAHLDGPLRCQLGRLERGHGVVGGLELR